MKQWALTACWCLCVPKQICSKPMKMTKGMRPHRLCFEYSQPSRKLQKQCTATPTCHCSLSQHVMQPLVLLVVCSLGACSSAREQHTLRTAICTVHHDPTAPPRPNCTTSQLHHHDPSAHLSSLLHIETLGEQVGYIDEAHEVVHIALYAACHPRVLDLHGKSAPIMKLASVHLSWHKNLRMKRSPLKV